jgi:hypothetical protein
MIMNMEQFMKWELWDVGFSEGELFISEEFSHKELITKRQKLHSVWYVDIHCIVLCSRGCNYGHRLTAVSKYEYKGMYSRLFLSLNVICSMWGSRSGGI